MHLESFSFAVAAGDFDGDGHADLAVGAPSETEGGLFGSGSVTALYGALFADGFETEDTGLWSTTAPRNAGVRTRTSAATAPGSSFLAPGTGSRHSRSGSVARACAPAATCGGRAGRNALSAASELPGAREGPPGACARGC
jgi:hypothetical protein